MVTSNQDLVFWNLEPKNPFLGKFGPKKSNFSVLPENWPTWYLEDVDSYSKISFLNLQPWIHFWINLGQKKSKLSILTENWHTEYLKDADSYSVISFLTFLSKFVILGKFGTKKSKLFFCLKIGIWSISKMLILIVALVFWNSNRESVFGQI